MIHYFAYGSNMDRDALQERGVTIYRAEPGILYYWKLVFNVIDDEILGACFANIEPDRDAHVEGIIYTLDQASIAALDRYEDYPRDYAKIILSIQPEQHHPIRCLVYIGQPDRCQQTLKPTPQYLQSLLKGQPFLTHAYYAQLQTVATLDE
jgi:cation transport regulator ChaC